MKTVTGLIVMKLLMIIFCQNALSQGVCVISERKVGKAAGVIAFVTPSNRLDGAKVSLRRKKKAQVVIKEVTSHQGAFEIDGVSNGKYMLVVSHPNAFTLWIPIEIAEKKRGKHLQVTLGTAIGDTCGGGEAKVIDSSTTSTEN